MIDELLHGLRGIPRPRLSAFFVPRVVARATSRPRRTPLMLKIYWLFVAFVAAPLTGSWIGLVAIVLAGGVFHALEA